MKHVVLHIGTGKTGTSTIQNALYLSRHSLRKASVDYASIARVKIDHFGEEIVAHYRLVELLRDGNDAELKRLRSYIEKNRADTIVFSCENLYHHLNRAQIEVLRDLLAGFRVTVVCYVRRQDKYIESAYKQQVKVGEAKIAFEDFAKRHRYRRFLRQVHANYFRLLKVWADIFGRDSIKVRMFDRSCFANGNLLDDFMDAIGLPDIELQSSPSGNANTALPSQLTQLIRAFNASGLIPRDDQQTFVEHLRTNYAFEDYPLIDFELRQKIIYNYWDVNEELKEYFSIEKGWSDSGLRKDTDLSSKDTTPRKSDFDLLASIYHSYWSQKKANASTWQLKKRLFYWLSDLALLLRILVGVYTVDKSLKRSDYLLLLCKMVLGSQFSPTFYRRSNLDIVTAGLDPFVHYIYYGCKEGRVPHPSVSAFEAKMIASRIDNKSYENQKERDSIVALLQYSDAIRAVLQDDIA